MSDPTDKEVQEKISEAVVMATVVNDVKWMRGSMEKQGSTLERIEQTLSGLPDKYTTKEEHGRLEKKVDKIFYGLIACLLTILGYIVLTALPHLKWG